MMVIILRVISSALGTVGVTMVVVWSLVFAALFSRPAPAAEFFVEGGAGVVQSLKTNDDGVWIQDRLPHTTSWTAMAFRGGIGVRVNDAWSLQTNYVRFGTGAAVTLNSVWQSDETYNSRCGLQCDHYQGHLWSTMHGGELVATYHPQLWALSPLIRAGLAGFEHTVNWQIEGTSAVHQYRGLVLAGVVGAGACYQQWLCVDTSYYRGFADTYYPLSTGTVVSMFTMKYHF